MVSFAFKHLQKLTRALHKQPSFSSSSSSSSLPTRLPTHSPHQPPHAFPADDRLRRFLESTASSRTLVDIKSLHGLVITMGPFSGQQIFFHNNIITGYVSLGELRNARKVFDEMPERNTVSYNALIGWYCGEGRGEMAWNVFLEMWRCGVFPSQATFGSLLAGDGVGVRRRGTVVHGVMVKVGLCSGDVVSGTALMGMYGRVGYVDEARRVFDDLERKSLITWNSMISMLGLNGFADEALALFGELMRAGCGLSGSTIVSLMSTISGKEELGFALHGLVIKNGYDYDILVSNTLLNMYLKCCGLAFAEKILKEMPFRDVVSYNTIIGAFAKDDLSSRALVLLQDLYGFGISPNKTTYVGLINCCTSLGVPRYGEYIHAKITKNALQHDVFVGSALVDFYGKCDMITAAHCFFNEIYCKNVTSWNALIASYSTQTSISLMRDMCRSGLQPNEFTFSSLMKTSDVFQVQMLHGLVIIMGYYNHEYVFSSLVNSYARNDLINEALNVAAFSSAPLQVVSSNVLAAIYSRMGQYEKSLEILSMLKEPDNVSWNVLLSACSHKGYHNEVFEVFKFMLMANVPHDNYTVVSVLSACTNLCSLPLGSCVHGLLIKTCFQHCDTFVCNILIDMYAKCGSVNSSVKIFDETSEKNHITWTALISALGHHGSAREAFKRFRDMEQLGIRPDSVTFTALLSVCRHGGLVKEGMELFSRMENVYGIKPERDHYLGVVDLLARYGHMNEAEDVISKMPFRPNAMVWRSLLGGHRCQETSDALSARSVTS